MGKGKQDLLNIFKVVFSNFSLLGAGIVTSFVLPAFLSMEDFGYYKIFNLYVTYIIILQFGIVEGVYMKYGGKTIEDVNKKEFTSLMKSLFLIEVAVGVVLVAISMFFLEGDVRFIGVSLAVNIVVVNITNLYQYLSQSIQRFSELSARNVAKAVLTILSVIAIFGLSKTNIKFADFKIVVLSIVAINFALLIWYMYTYRNLFSSAKLPSKNVILDMMKAGFPLCLANIISTLILNISRQIVSMFFPTTDYAVYSFAYSLLTLISTVVTSVAVVMFSMFKKQDTQTLLSKYSLNMKTVSVLMSMAMAVYFPLCWFVNLILPDYSYSLDIFRIVIPGLVFSSPVTIVIHNYYKALDKNTKFFIFSAIVLGVSVISGVGIYFAFNTMESVSWASVVVMLVWYVLTEVYLKKKYHVSAKFNLCYMVIMSAAFYIVSHCFVWYIGLVAYGMIFAVGTLIYHKLTKVVQNEQA